MTTVDRAAPEAAFDSEGKLPCSLCERDCLEEGEHVFITYGVTVVQVACRDCAPRFREIFRLSLAAARGLARAQRENEGGNDDE